MAENAGEKIKTCDFPDTKGQYATTCPTCGADEGIEVIRFAVETRIPLFPNGFGMCDAEHVDTSDEVCRCNACDAEFPLADLLIGEEAADAKTQ